MCVCVRMCPCTCVLWKQGTPVCLGLCLRMYVWVSVCVCWCVWARVCMCECVYTCISVFVYACLRACLLACLRACETHLPNSIRLHRHSTTKYPFCLRTKPADIKRARINTNIWKLLEYHPPASFPCVYKEISKAGGSREKEIAGQSSRWRGYLVTLYSHDDL